MATPEGVVGETIEKRGPEAMKVSTVIERANGIYSDFTKQLGSDGQVAENCAAGAAALKRWSDGYLKHHDGESMMDVVKYFDDTFRMIQELQLVPNERSGASALALALGDIADQTVEIGKKTGEKFADRLQQQARRASLVSWELLREMDVVQKGTGRLRQSEIRSQPPQMQAQRLEDRHPHL